MNKKALSIIVAGVLCIGIVCVAIAIFSKNSPSITDTTSNPFASTTIPGGTGASIPTGEKTIATQNGQSVEVPDFTENRVPLSADDDTYYDLVHTGPVFGDEDDSFGVQFQSSNSYFLVTLLKEPLGASRHAAEDFLRSTLQLSDAELCILNLQVFAMNDVNPTYSDKGNLGLSFCPGAVQLPQ